MKEIKYRIFTDNKTMVIAASTYAGKVVKGIARCKEGDTFDFEKGKALAIAKCNLKVQKRRWKRAQRHYQNIKTFKLRVEELFNDACAYYTNAYYLFTEAAQDLEKILKEM